MKHSIAFKMLLDMSQDIPLYSAVGHRRIAHYISRVMMVEDIIQSSIDDKLHPRYRFATWVHELKDKKETVLHLFLQLTDSEWEDIKSIMMRLAESSEDVAWKTKRIGWVHALDTLRAFN